MKLVVTSKSASAFAVALRMSGAKNALLPALFATPLLEGETQLKNAPLQLRDYKNSRLILSSLGLKFTEDGDTVEISNKGLISKANLPYVLTKGTRCSLYLLGALAKKCGCVEIGLPGGCSFGVNRQFDLHVKGLQALGALVEVSNEQIILRYQNERNARYVLPFPSVGATTNMILYAVLGTSEIELVNCAVEPEIQFLVELLNAAGAKIEMDVLARQVSIKGVPILHGSSVEVISDRIQTMTYVALAAMHKKRLVLENVSSLEHITVPLNILVKAGLNYDYCSQSKILTVYGDKLETLSGMDIHCHPYPGFPTDLQPIFAALALVAESSTSIRDHVIPERVAYLDEIKKLKASVAYDQQGGIAIYPCQTTLVGNVMKSTDLRAGMACVMAASIAEGRSEITNADQIFRGYHELIKNVSHFVEVLDEENQLNSENTVARVHQYHV